ncbi:PREDICTED: EF-hand domain-containing family member B-like [Priapulus caudatus]|uniref:EF-hand domain-containing family member B-like n=1 Tax=Priapulus caudatus TaxID=37621 RepID=A0ABM1DQ55_PRICU|nr:PREDICTED: EF-hand domain-containing family member B-like [Priapulus caudatus]
MALTDHSSVKDCLQSLGNASEIPEAVRRHRASLNPEPGQIRVYHGRAHDSDRRRAADLTHGVSTNFSIMASELVTPAPATLMQAQLDERRERMYASHRQAPLGRSRHQAPDAPCYDTSDATVFGSPQRIKDDAGVIVNPAKSPRQVDAEYEQGRELYRLTHRNFGVGESVDRKYDWSAVRATTFGIATPHDNAGRNVRQTLQWNDDADGNIISKRLDEFRERTQPQLARVYSPLKDTLKVGDEQAFGVRCRRDQYDAGDLIHARAAPACQRNTDKQRGMLAAIRQQLKKANYHNFPTLAHAFGRCPRDGATDAIDADGLRKMCERFNLTLSDEMLRLLMQWCDTNADGRIDYNEFANFLNWKDMLPSSDLAETNERIPTLQKQIDKAIEDYRTSSSDIAAVAGAVDTSGYRKYGVPTIRSDLPVPNAKKISDTKNYGEEPDASGLLNPNMLSSYGLMPRDVFTPRPKEAIRQVFTNLTKMSQEVFEELWGKATAKHPSGLVSIESFRQALEENEECNQSK